MIRRVDMVHYLETNSLDPCFNLAFEEHVLETRRVGSWLMLWQDAPSVIIGLNQLAAAEVDGEFARARGIAVVRRATGGGAVYHDAGNMNYSIFGDAGDAASLSLSRFMEPVCRALRALGVPAEATGRNDITVNGLKVSGTAQRLSGGRILHHGTLLFETDAATMSAVLRPDTSKFESKAAKSVRSRVGQIRDFLPDGATLADFKAALLAELTEDGLVRETLTDAELDEIRRLADEKYRSWDWTWARAPEFGFKNSRRFPGGTLTVSLDVSGGVIRRAHFCGDFMALIPCAPAQEALMGVRFEREAVISALSGLDMRPMLGTITAEDVASVIFEPHLKI